MLKGFTRGSPITFCWGKKLINPRFAPYPLLLFRLNEAIPLLFWFDSPLLVCLKLFIIPPLT